MLHRAASAVGTLRRGFLRGLSTDPGFAGIPGLLKPDDWFALAKETEERCTELVRLTLETPPSAGTVRLLDDTSDVLCRTLDAAEFCRNVHSDPEWRDSAERACLELGTFVQRLNTHEGLYDKIAAAIRIMEGRGSGGEGVGEGQGARGLGEAGRPSPSPKRPSGPLDQEAETLLVARMLLRDFERYGVHLDERGKARMDTLVSDTQRVGYMIGNNLVDPRALGTVELPTAEAALPGAIPSSISGSARERRFPSASGGQHYVALPGDGGTLAALMRGSTSPAVRLEAYAVQQSSPAANAALLDRLVADRREIAELAGYESYAAYQLDGFTLAARPEAADEFLADLTYRLAGPACQEALRLAALRDRELGDLRTSWAGGGGGRGHAGPGDGPGLAAWDAAYYEAREEELASDADATAVLRRLQGAFTLEGCVRGLAALLRDALGVRLVERPLRRSEGWATGVRALEALDEDGERLGTVYLDLLARPGKFSGAAHFVLRCGRRAASEGDEPVLPVLALAASLSPASLGPEAVELLFHEAGHAMHTLLSRTSYQHLSGTRGPLDMMEVPSHALEAFARSGHGLAAAAGAADDAGGRGGGRRVPRTSTEAAFFDGRPSAAGTSLDPPPFAAPPPPVWRATAATLRDTRARSAARHLGRQVALARTDALLHGPEAPQGTAASLAVGRVFRDCLPYRHDVPPAARRRRVLLPHARLGHLVGYGATYYSYLYAQALAARLWETRLAPSLEDPDLLREEGRRVTERLLRPGGAKEAPELILDVFEGDSKALRRIGGGWAPDPTSLLAGLGIAGAGAGVGAR